MQAGGFAHQTQWRNRLQAFFFKDVIINVVTAPKKELTKQNKKNLEK
jgi:hypothetical protein